jgi:hypothetical protein
LCLAVPAFAVDGVVLINQGTVTAAGGFPYVISQPGSYKLSGNLVVKGDTDGIDITANNVSLDLNGFTISGPDICSGSPPTCTGVAGSGVYSNSNNVAVRNGSVTGFYIGVRVDGGPQVIVEEISASGNFDAGISATSGVVRRNTASNNGLYGIVAMSSVVTENVANLNNGFGINAYDSVVLQNVANSNTSYGVAATRSIVGSNALSFNGAGAIQPGGNVVSQGNNYCGTTTPC